MAIGEAGSITTNSPTENQPITVTLTEALDDPVFALTATNNGGDPFTLRVIGQTLDGSGNTTAFTFIIEEWEYLDGPHPATETINWLAVEAGVHTLPDGRVIEAGTVSANHTNSAVSLTGSFSDPPVVLTSVMSNNDTTTVDSDPLNITTSGFNVRLQEEEGQPRAHAFETVGYIAISPGGGGDDVSGTADTFDTLDHTTDTFSLGDTFTNAIVLGETQTINGGNPGSVSIEGQTASTVDMRFVEETSQDAETNHVDETVGIVAFEDGLIPCLTPGTLVATPQGERPVETLRPGDGVLTHGGDVARLGMVLTRHLDAQALADWPGARPVRIMAGALGAGLPRRDLLVSPQHRMLLCSPLVARMFDAPEVLIAAHRLTVLPGIFTDDTPDVTYVHLVFARHRVVLAEGTPTESFFPGPEALRTLPDSARVQMAQLFPHYLRAPTVPARPIPKGGRQKALTRRMVKNRRLALEGLAAVDIEVPWATPAAPVAQRSLA